MLTFFNRHKNTAVSILSLSFAIIAVGLIIYYILGPSAAFLHSDCTDTILWAQASYESKSLFSSEFNYAALLPFGGTMLMIPFIGIFGVSMTTHHIGMVLFTLLFFASVYFLCKSADFGNNLSFFTVGVTALTLCASEKLREIFYEHVIYYSICVAVICVLLGIVMKFPDIFAENTKRSKVVLICLATYLIAFLSAFDGMQVIATGIIPVLFAVAAQVLLSKEKIFSKSNMPSIYFAVITVFSMLIGLAALKAATRNVTAGYADAYSSYSNINEWLKNLGNVVEHWFMLFGVDAVYGMKIFSLESIINIVRIAAALIIALVPVVSIFFYNKFERKSRLIILAHFGLTAVIMFGYVFGILSAANWRLSPMICTGILVCAATAKIAMPYMVPKRIACAGAALLILMSGISLKTVADMPKNGIVQNEKYSLINHLREQGFEYGFATFWNSNSVTLLSDSEITLRSVTVDDKGISPYLYQGMKKWFDSQDGVEKYCVILTEGEKDTLSTTADWVYFETVSSNEEKFENYYIYTFESIFFIR